MAFVVDGAEWCFDGWSEFEVIEALEGFLERVSIARDRREVVWIGDDLQSRQVLGALDFWSLTSPKSPVSLPRELVQELTPFLDRSPLYLDGEWPDGFDAETLISVDGAPASSNSDVAWVHHQVRIGTRMACLGLRRAGSFLTRSEHGSVGVHWVANETSHRSFWREMIELKHDCKDTLEELCQHAFPELYFCVSVWKGLRKFEGGYSAVSAILRRYLSVLDDHGHWAFTCTSTALTRREARESECSAAPSKQIIGRRFLGLGLAMAPEKPNVKQNRTCREAREIVIDGHTLYCEWHGKLQAHRNRIHIHAPVEESGKKVVVAILHAHLPLP